MQVLVEVDMGDMRLSGRDESICVGTSTTIVSSGLSTSIPSAPGSIDNCVSRCGSVVAVSLCPKETLAPITDVGEGAGVTNTLGVDADLHGSSFEAS